MGTYGYMKMFCCGLNDAKSKTNYLMLEIIFVIFKGKSLEYD